MSVLESRIHELIAVGASVAATSSSCLEFRVAKAGEAGAGPDEILAAIDTGRQVPTGAAATMDRTARALLVGELVTDTIPYGLVAAPLEVGMRGADLRPHRQEQRLRPDENDDALRVTYGHGSARLAAQRERPLCASRVPIY